MGPSHQLMPHQNSHAHQQDPGMRVCVYADHGSWCICLPNGTRTFANTLAEAMILATAIAGAALGTLSN